MDALLCLLVMAGTWFWVVKQRGEWNLLLGNPAGAGCELFPQPVNGRCDCFAILPPATTDLLSELTRIKERRWMGCKHR